MAYVYRHIRHDKNQPFYIGVGNDDSGKYKRAYELGGTRKASVIWNRIVAKTGFTVEIILDDLSFSQALEKEKEFIKLYGRINTNTGILANMTDGGEGSIGRVITEEIRQKCSKGRKGKSNSQESNIKRRESQIGKFVSEETRRKISKSNKGKIISDTQKSILSKVNTGRVVSQETKDKIKRTRSSRTYVYNGRKKTNEEIEKIRKSLWGHKRCLGYKHTKEACLNMKNANKERKAVLQFLLDGTLIAEYDSQREAEKQTGFKKESIGRACRGVMGYKNNIMKGFIWKHK